MKKKIIFMITCLVFTGWTYAQSSGPSVIASAGGISHTESISLEWTLGETAVGVINSTGKIFTEGYHQPTLEVSVINADFTNTELWSNGNENITDYQISIAPNPVRSILNVRVESNLQTEVFIDLFDQMGKNLTGSNKEGVFGSFDMNLHHLPAGIYVLKFTDTSGRLIKSYKISKIN